MHNVRKQRPALARKEQLQGGIGGAAEQLPSGAGSCGGSSPPAYPGVPREAEARLGCCRR